MNKRREAVIVLTQPEDVTADIVIEEMQRRDVPVHKVDSADFPLRASLTGRLGSPETEVVMRSGGVEIGLNRVRSIWYRRPSDFRFPDEVTVSTLRFLRAEARQAYSGLLLAPEIFWMNEPRHESLASLKAVQLRTAAQLGMRVPRTLITNDPDDAREFLDSAGGDVIYKRMANALLYTDDGELTAFITSKLGPDHREALAHVAVTPCLFQEYIEKRYELRITVVGAKVFGARVDSQGTPEARTDWRNGGDLVWEPYSVPDDLGVRLVRFLQVLNLRFGAFDVIREVGGGYVFLECNPAGQWAWFDDEITLPIRDAIIEALTLGEAAG